MGKEIFNTKGMAEAIRYTEYRDIYSALAELVDNSIEAKATDVIIALKIFENGEAIKVIEDIATIDNGTGMDEERLQECLVFGSSTKTDRTSIGRFGVGLGQASLFAAPRVEVYSWQNKKNPYFVYLDANEMKSGAQTLISEPIMQEWPTYFSGFRNIYLPIFDRPRVDFSEHGTLVYWKNVDKANMRVTTFTNKLSEDLGKRFRYYLNDGLRIFITDTALTFLEEVKVIDPMFLMSSSKYLGSLENTTELTDSIDKGEPIFEPLITELSPGGETKIRVVLDYKGRNTIFSEIIIRTSVVKEKFYYGGHFPIMKYNSPGDTPIGKLLKKYESISINRVRREIQFDRFGLYESINDPKNRWWSMEIEFSPILDEFFKLSNNKQKIEIMKVHYDNYIKLQSQKGINVIHDADTEDIEEKLWIELVSTVRKLISLARKRNQELFNSSSVALSRRKTQDEIVINKPYVDNPKQVDDFSNLKKMMDPIHDHSNQVVIHNEYKAKMDILSDSDDLIRLDKTKENLEVLLNYEHPYFELRNSEDNDKLDQKILEVLGIVFTNIKQKFITYDERIFFDKLMKEFNSEMNKVIIKRGKND